MLSRWIYKQLLPPVDSVAEEEPDSDRASALRQAQPLETQLLLTGRREIDGPLDSGSGLYPQDYLVEDVRDLSRGQRCAGSVTGHTPEVNALWRAHVASLCLSTEGMRCLELVMEGYNSLGIYCALDHGPVGILSGSRCRPVFGKEPVESCTEEVWGLESDSPAM